MTEVVAALIWDGDRFLICQRPAHKARGLLWEFVGGKVELGETKEDALMRECREELDITLSVGDLAFTRHFFQYNLCTCRIKFSDFIYIHLSKLLSFFSFIPKRLQRKSLTSFPYWGGSSTTSYSPDRSVCNTLVAFLPAISLSK